MVGIPPGTVITVTALRNEAVDVGIPFQVSAQGVKNHDKTGSGIQGFVLSEKHAGNNAVNSMKMATKEGAAIQEKISELPINGKDAVAVGNIHKLKGHRGCALHSVEIAAGRAEAAVAAERDEFQLSKVRKAVHGTAKGRVTTVDYFIYVFNNRSTWMQYINHFFIMVLKNIM